MQVYIKETLYVLDYQDNIVDMIFVSDDSRTPGYAYNINITDSNTGYSDLTFTMPTRIMDMPNELADAPASERWKPNDKLEKLLPLTKIRYNREVYYTGDTEATVVVPEGYGDTTTYKEVTYYPDYPRNLIENYVMDYIIQPLDKKREGHEVSLNFTAIDYPRFNLSKKKFGLTINEETITRKDWSIYEKKPMDVPGTVKYLPWIYNYNKTGFYSAEESWDPTISTEYPLTESEIGLLMKAREGDAETVWPYGLTATVFYWPITKTGRFGGILYSEGDYLTLNIYPKFKTGEVDIPERIENYLEFYGYEWTYLEKGDWYLTPNNPCNYLSWILENTNWSIKGSFEQLKDVAVILDTDQDIVYGDGREGQYLLVKNVITNDNFVGVYTDNKDLFPKTASTDSWLIYTVKEKDKTVGCYLYCWDGNKWYMQPDDEDFIITTMTQYDGKKWNQVDMTNESWTHAVDKKTGELYDVDIAVTEVPKPNGSVGDLFETTELRTTLSCSESNCYNAITEIAKAFQLYPMFDCENRTVSLKLFSGKNYGLTYHFGHSLSSTSVKEDGDKVITKLYSYGGQDTNGEEKINLGDANREYENKDINPDNIEPWNPNAPEYIQKRSPYGTNYIYNFKWMYDNGWMTKEQILGLYEKSQEIQDLKLCFLDKFTTDYTKTQDEYVNAGVNLSTNQDEYTSILNAMMNVYYRWPGTTTEKFSAFPFKPADCKVSGDGHVFTAYYCDKCFKVYGSKVDKCTNSTPNGGTCTGGTIKTRDIPIEVWSADNTSSVQLDPSSKGYFQEIAEQLGVENEGNFIYLGTKFEVEEIPGGTESKKEYSFKINGKTVYDKSSHLYHWNGRVDKWLEYLGYALKNEVELSESQKKVEEMDKSFKLYQLELARLENDIQDNYGDYLIEGRFTDEQIVYPAVLLNKTLEASDQYAVPKITYSANVIDSSGLIEYRAPVFDTYNELVHSLHNLGQVVPKAGDYVAVYDEPMGLYGVPGLITSIKRVIDNPQANSITVDTSYTDNEELVGNIISATNTVLNNSDIYARTAILKSDGTISSVAINKTLETSGKDNLAFVGVKGNSLLDSTGLLVTNPADPSRKMKYTGAGIYGTVDNGATYEPLVTPEGINANYISSGTIDTNKIQILSGSGSKVILDNHGLVIKKSPSAPYYLPEIANENEMPNWTSKTKDGEDRNIKAFIGVDRNNHAMLYLSGQMLVEKGSKIAGWNVGTTELSSGEGSNYIALKSSGDYAIQAGQITTTDSEGNTITYPAFSVTHSGNVFAANGTFAGNIIANSLTLGSGVKVGYDSIDNAPEVNMIIFKDGTIGKLTAEVGTTETAGGFKVSSEGLLQATNAVISGTIYAKDGHFTGKITATELELGSGVLIDYNNLKNTPDIPEAPDLTGYIKADGSVIIGKTDNEETSFSVSTQGLLTAKNAVITGKIIASGGTIGGWNIGTVTQKQINSSHSGFINGTEEERTYLGSKNNTNSADGAASSYYLSQRGLYNYCSMNGSRYDDFFLFFKDRFAVATDGSVYMKNATIQGSSSYSGTITSSSATITGGTITLNEVKMRAYNCYVDGAKRLGIAIGCLFLCNDGKYTGYLKGGTDGNIWLHAFSGGAYIATGLSDYLGIYVYL